MTYRFLLSALLLIVVESGQAPHTTLATLSTTVGAAANGFSAGTVHIADSLGAGTTLSMSDLVAGDNFDTDLIVANGGTLDVRYALTTTISGSAALADELQLTVRTRTTNPCASRDGSTLYSGDLSAAALGDPAHGAQAGDRVLASSTNETLCFEIELPTSATLQGANVGATFHIDAEQS
jgi:hypothetical protein